MLRGLPFVVLCGCQALYGVPSTDASIDMPLAAGGDTVTGMYTVSNYDLDATGALTQHHVDAYRDDQLAISVVLADGTAPHVTYHTDSGAFTFARDVAGMPYRLRMTREPNAAAPTITEYQLAEPNVAFEDIAAHHEVQLVTAGSNTQLSVQVNGANGGDATGVSVVTTGVWTAPPIMPTANDTYTFDWPSVAPLSGDPGLLDSSHGDHVIVTQTVAITGSDADAPKGYAAVAKIGSTASTLADATDNMITVDIGPPPTLECARLAQLQSADETRLTSAFGSAATRGYASELGVVATVVHGLGSPIELPLATGSDTVPIDMNLEQDFANPYPLTALEAESDVGFTRTLASSNQPLRTELRYREPLTTSACPVATPLTVPVGGALLTAPVLDGMALGSDDQPFALAADHDPVLAWTETTANADLHADYYAIFVDEVGTGTPTPARTLQIVTTAPTAIVPRDALVAHRTYIFEMQSVRGAQHAGSGDFSPTDGPSVVGTTWSSSFVVGTP